MSGVFRRLTIRTCLYSDAIGERLRSDSGLFSNASGVSLKIYAFIRQTAIQTENILITPNTSIIEIAVPILYGIIIEDIIILVNRLNRIVFV